MSIFTRGNNPGAYSGRLTCPVCKSNAIRFVENLGPHRLRYRCRKCGLPFQYDTSNNPYAHPYAPLAKKGKFRDIVDLSKVSQGGQKGR